MILDIRQFEEFPARIVLESPGSSFSRVSEDVSSLGTVFLDLSIQNSGEEYFCQGTIHADAELECSRCLTSYKVTLETPVGFIVRSEEITSSKKGDPVDNEEYVYLQGSNLQADLSGIIRQALLLAIPMKPECDESCKGLCPQCGTNLNTNRCTCDTKTIDPRWEGLNRLAGQNRERN
jgi:uncharacterized protein